MARVSSHPAWMVANVPASQNAKILPVLVTPVKKVLRNQSQGVPVSNFSEKVAFIWSVADLLRGPYKPHQYGRVILPLTVLRRLDCVLEPTKAKVLEKHAALKDSKIKEPEPILNKVAGHAFHNTSKLNFQKLKGDPDKAAQNLSHYIKSFSSRKKFFKSASSTHSTFLPAISSWSVASA